MNKKKMIAKMKKQEITLNSNIESKRHKKRRPIKIKKETKNKIEKSYGDLTRRKRMRNSIFILVSILICLIVRIGWIQFVQGEELKSEAYVQQTLDRTVNPKRGTIYDCTGKNILAMSATVYTVTVNPVNIDASNKEKIASKLSNMFDLDYEKTLKKVTKRSSIETIVKKIEKDKADELSKWMQENNINEGINIDEDTKRYYPNNNLASQIIGFCGSDNQGLDGIEAIYDETLKGSTGKIVRVTDAKGGTIEDTSEEYVSAVDGNDLVLTIDMNIQGIAEKYLKEACIDNVCTDGGNILIMNPQNGDVLAIAGYPNYDLNNPYGAYTEELKGVWDTLSQEDKTKNLQQVWRNKAVTDAYEPGSTFKLITSSAALEEGITTTDKAGEFTCTGSIEIAGVRMKCWRYYRPHGPESLRDALMNSCNPVFIGLGQKIGVQKYYSYLRKFGFLQKTGIDLPGEGTSIFLAENKVGPVELGTIAFGQRFEITPIQMATAVSAIANGGTYIHPRVVKQIINSETGEKIDIEIKKEDRVISEETAKNVLSMMETVVAQGTGKNAQVKGYSIGGKTGTSEDGVNTGKYVTSFIGTAPISNPEVVILITLYNPTGEGGHQGGGVAAPIASQVLGEVLPYLDVIKDNIAEEDIVQEVEVPDIIGKKVKEAKKILKEVNLDIELIDYNEEQEIDNEMVITTQVPASGIKVNSGTKIKCK